MNRWAIGGLVFAAAVALALRCPQLAERPMHNDEAVNAVKYGELAQRGVYKYDPSEYHGPTLPYSTFLINRLTGGPDYVHLNESRLRFIPVLFGVGLVL